MGGTFSVCMIFLFTSIACARFFFSGVKSPARNGIQFSTAAASYHLCSPVAIQPGCQVRDVAKNPRSH